MSNPWEDQQSNYRAMILAALMVAVSGVLVLLAAWPSALAISIGATAILVGSGVAALAGRALA